MIKVQSIIPTKRRHKIFLVSIVLTCLTCQPHGMLSYGIILWGTSIWFFLSPALTHCRKASSPSSYVLNPHPSTNQIASSLSGRMQRGTCSKRDFLRTGELYFTHSFAWPDLEKHVLLGKKHGCPQKDTPRVELRIRSLSLIAWSVLLATSPLPWVPSKALAKQARHNVASHSVPLDSGKDSSASCRCEKTFATHHRCCTEPEQGE